MFLVRLNIFNCPALKFLLPGWAVLVLMIMFSPVCAEIPMPADVATCEDHFQIKEAKSASSLYNWYSKVSEKSIHRCPFHISCSNYALQSFEEKGSIHGLLLTIDRYYFRENSSARYLYLRKTRDGRRLLDDKYFLYGELK